MSTARRWTKWWWQDWQRDPALRMCSPAARGIWMDLLAIMFDAEPCGHLLVNGRQPTERQLAAVCGASIDELTSCLSELEEAGAFSRSEDGVIFNRRMVRDKAISDEASANGKMGGNPTLTGGLNPKRTTGIKRGVKAGVNPNSEDGLTTPLKHQEAEAEADIDSSLRSESGDDNSLAQKPAVRVVGYSEPTPTRGSRLPVDWKPDEELISFARENGCDPDHVSAKFRDYWLGVSGHRGVKLDWRATFRNWCRSDAERGGSKPQAPTRQEKFRETWKDVPDLEAFTR